MNSFPREINAWKNDVARRLVGLRGAVNDIFLGMPQIPDPEIGMPFSGPLSPVPFVWHPQPNTGGTMGTPSTVADHCPACPTALVRYEFSVSGITNGTCLLCNNVNGSHVLQALSGQFSDIGESGSVGTIAACEWRSAKIPFCTVVTTIPPTTWVYWWMQIITSSGDGNPAIRVHLSYDLTAVVYATYQYLGCPPSVGSGSGSVTLTRIATSARCSTFPTTATLRGIS